jgi:hypothetical protein
MNVGKIEPREEERSPEFSLRVALCYPDLAMQW